MKNTYYCPIEVTLEALSGKWKGAILWWLSKAPHRFSELRYLIPVSAETLSKRLGELEVHGLVQRLEFKEKPPRVEYSLTPLGEELAVLTDQLCRFGKKIEPDRKYVFDDVLDSLK